MKTLKQAYCIIIALILICSSNSVKSQTVNATVGTQPTGKADGVTIWVNPNNTSKSLIIGSDPSRGLATFDLKGRLVEFINFGGGGSAGVDVRYDFPLGNEKIALITSGVNKKNTLKFFKVNPKNNLLEDVTGEAVALNVNAYGSCMYHSSKTGKFYVIVTSREGLIEQWELFDNKKGKVEAKLVREINILDGTKEKLNAKTEVCVADDELGKLYISQEMECMIWKYNAEPEDGNERVLVDMARIAEEDNVEGLAIYHVGEEEGYLIASIQNSWKYKVYSRKDNKYIGTFDAKTNDGSNLESHDCIELTNVPLGEKFPAGLMVTQNANNICGKQFQLIPWESIAAQFNLKTDISYTPYKKAVK